MQPSVESGKNMLNKVPAVTLFFWIIKALCTTVGETAADFLNAKLNLGLTGTSIVMGVLLIVALIFQFRARSYVTAFMRRGARAITGSPFYSLSLSALRPVISRQRVSSSAISCRL